MSLPPPFDCTFFLLRCVCNRKFRLLPGVRIFDGPPFCLLFACLCGDCLGEGFYFLNILVVCTVCCCFVVVCGTGQKDRKEKKQKIKETIREDGQKSLKRGTAVRTHTHTHTHLPFQLGSDVLGTHLRYCDVADLRVTHADASVCAERPAMVCTLMCTLESIHR